MAQKVRSCLQGIQKTQNILQEGLCMTNADLLNCCLFYMGQLNLEHVVLRPAHMDFFIVPNLFLNMQKSS